MRVRLLSLPLALALLLFAAPAANAQGGFGFKGGLAQSRLSSTPDASEALRGLSGVTAGGFLVVGSRAPVTGQFEALIAQRGADVTGDIAGLFRPGTLRSTYLDVSAFLRAHAGGDAGTRVYFYGGPTIGFELKTEFIADGRAADFDAATENWDVILTAGGGVEIGRLLLEGRYNHGLSNLLAVGDVFGFQAKHRSVMLLAGARF